MFVEYLQGMGDRSDPVEFVGRSADERLLGEGAQNLPVQVGHPESLPPPSRARRRIVGVGATLTGVTLVLGVALIVFGAVEVISNAIAVAIAALALGVLFVGTHWGWVHVAELSANSIEGRRNSEVLDRRRLWLDTVQPYTRYEITTTVDDDGSIHIVRAVYRPVASGDNGFTFERAVEHEEVRSADEPSAQVAERAEVLRRQAAVDTERERERFQIASDAYEAALLGRDDAEQQQAARRAASQALSEQINANLRDPPLVE
jgi:hypothetical protein